MKKLFIVTIITILLSSCFRLDDNLFSPDDKITEYKLENYEGEQHFVLDASYAIPSNLVSIFTLNSQAPSESSPTTIYAIYIGDINTISTDTVIMYCHGNSNHMDYYWQRAKLLANCGGKNNYGVLMVDYRGYGLSEGEPSEDGLYADVDAALNWLKGNGLTNDKLVIYGYSMGSAPATELTAKPRSMNPFKLILEAPFASAAVMVQDASVLGVPSSFITNLSVDNAEEIKSINQPFMWMHGVEDLFLNINTHGQVVYDNYQGSYKEAHKISGADHGDVPVLYGYQNYCNDVNTFIKK
ncbi:MAG: alpha/beta fold hydrolase [Flavobacteriales bacterium]|nr:alpha/beta fold hydrolase [Flavobacteriales bacterium]